MCVVLYSFISSSNTKQKPLLVQNQSQPFTEINTTTSFIPYLNISFIHEFSNENIRNQTESSDSEVKSEETEPQALEYGSGIRRYFPESNIPRPFIYEIRDPKPSGFQVPQIDSPKTYEDNEAAENNAKPIRTRVRNIQDIIKLLTNQNEDQDTENSSKKVKLNRNQKKLGLHPKRNSQPFTSDPFFPYKPQNPSDINLLATNGFRFAPTIQLDPKKKHQFVEQYPNYEKPMDSKDSNYPEQPISVTLDLSQNKRHKKRKPINTPIGFNNLYNQNQYFNPGNRYQPSQQYLNKQPYFRPWNHWNLAPNANRQKVRNGVLQQTIKGQSPMIVHLNLYPKKRKPLIEDSEIEESKIHHNCSDHYEAYNFAQMRNASEFNQVLGHTRHQTLDPIYNGKVTTTTTDRDNENIMYNVNDESHPHQFVSKPNVEIQKSIGFTIVNPNFSGANLSEDDFYSTGESESQWHPIIIPDDENVSNARDDRVEESDKDGHYGLEVGEVNEGSDETVTLPLPQDLFQKYFNRKPTTGKSTEDWDPNVISQNPNLINHRASFYDERKVTKDNI